MSYQFLRGAISNTSPVLTLLKRRSRSSASSQYQPLYFYRDVCRQDRSISYSRGSSLAASASPAAVTSSSASSRKKKVEQRNVPRNIPRDSFSQQYINKRREDFLSHERKATENSLKWDIVLNLLVERRPIIIPDPKPWQEKFWYIQRLIAEKGSRVLPKELDLMGDRSILEKSDEEIIKSLPFKLAPRRTKSDREGNIRTLNRALDKSLYLLVKYKNKSIGNGGYILPQYKVPDEILENEAGHPIDYLDENLQAAQKKAALTKKKRPFLTATDLIAPILDTEKHENTMIMRKSHENFLKELFVGKTETYIPSNSPLGFYMNLYDDQNNDSKVDGKYGSKNFIYISQHVKGRGSVFVNDVEDTIWVTREEIKEGEYIKDARLKETLALIS